MRHDHLPFSTVPRALLLAVGLTAAATAAQAQQPAQVPELTPVDIFTRQEASIVLSLDRAVDIALENSFSVYQWRQQFLQSAYSLESTRRRLRTQLNFQGTLPSISQTINADLVTIGGGDPQIYYLRSGATNVNAALSLDQQLITDGRVSLSVRMSGVNSMRQLPSGNETLNRSVQPSVTLNYQQPLFQYNQMRGTLRNAELAYERLSRRYTETELERINQITRQFYQLFQQQRQLEIVAESFQQSDLNYQTGQRRFNAGLIARVDAMQLEVTRANDMDRLESQKNSHRQSMFVFNRLVGLPLEEKIWVEASLEYVPIQVDLDQALQLAFANRADLRLAEIELEQADMSLQQTVSAGRPNLQLNLGYTITGNSTLGGLGADDSWDRHLTAGLNADNRNNNSNVSVTLRIPVFDWGVNRSNVERQLASMAVTRRNQSEVREDLRRDVINRIEAVESAMRRMEIQTNVRAVSDTSYHISVQRYERGEITLTDLLRAHESHVNTQNAYTAALIAYENAKADLQAITLWDWVNNRPIEQRTTPPRTFVRDPL